MSMAVSPLDEEVIVRGSALFNREALPPSTRSGMIVPSDLLQSDNGQ